MKILVQGNINAMLLIPIVFLGVEMIVVKTLVGIIKKEEERLES